MKYELEVKQNAFLPSEIVVYKGECDSFPSICITTRSSKEASHQHCILNAVQILPTFTLKDGYNSNGILISIRIDCPEGYVATAKLEDMMLWIEPVKEVVHA